MLRLTEPYLFAKMLRRPRRYSPPLSKCVREDYGFSWKEILARELFIGDASPTINVHSVRGSF
jgi:hypothetical protein